MQGVKRIRIVSIFVLAIIISLDSFSYATGQDAKNTILTLEKAISLANDNNHQLTVIDRTIENLWEQENNMMKLFKNQSEQYDSYLQMMNLYTKRKSGEALTTEELFKLQGYWQVYGVNYQGLTEKEIFYAYIQNRDFPHYSVWASIQNLKIDREMTTQANKGITRSLYDRVLELYNFRDFQRKQYSLLVKQNTLVAQKLKKGLVVELDLWEADKAVKKQQIEIDKLERDIANAEMLLKKHIGYSLGVKVDIVEYDTFKGYSEPLPMEHYISEALSHRGEILKATMDLGVQQRELEIIKNYFTNTLDIELQEAQQKNDEKQIALNETISLVSNNIAIAYKEVIIKFKSLTQSEKSFMNAKKQFENGVLKQKLGLITALSLRQLEVKKDQSEYTCENSLRDYKTSLKAIGAASGIGPNYIPEGGELLEQ